MSEYDLNWWREVLKYVCGISFLIVATYILFVSCGFDSPVLEDITDGFFLSGVISGWGLVIIDFVFMVRGNDDA